MKILSVLIVLSSGICAYCFSQKYVKRFTFYKELCDFCSFYIDNISFNNCVLEDIFRKYKELKVYCCPEIDLLQEFIKGTIKEFDVSYLVKQEREEVVSFFKNVGCFSLDVELKRAEGFKSVINKKMINCEHDKLKKQPLVYKLGIVLGVVVAIIII